MSFASAAFEILEREESIERKAVRLRCLHQESFSVPIR
jgi:hypothetical protein